MDITCVDHILPFLFLLLCKHHQVHFLTLSCFKSVILNLPNVLQPFNVVPHVMVAKNHKIIFLAIAYLYFFLLL